MIEIEKVQNGCILQYNGTKEVYNENEMDKLFSTLLQLITGKASCFGGNAFGEIQINFDEKLRLTVKENN